jgi:hypothetical protein
LTEVCEDITRGMAVAVVAAVAAGARAGTGAVREGGTGTIYSINELSPKRFCSERFFFISD